MKKTIYLKYLLIVKIDEWIPHIFFKTKLLNAQTKGIFLK